MVRLFVKTLISSEVVVLTNVTAHVCNRRFSGRACLLPHPGFRHFSAVNTSQGPR